MNKVTIDQKTLDDYLEEYLYRVEIGDYVPASKIYKMLRLFYSDTELTDMKPSSPDSPLRPSKSPKEGNRRND